jgi:hypothetical protein
MASNNGFGDPVKFAEQLFGVKFGGPARYPAGDSGRASCGVKACYASGKTFAAAICYRQCKH